MPGRCMVHAEQNYAYLNNTIIQKTTKCNTIQYTLSKNTSKSNTIQYNKQSKIIQKAIQYNSTKKIRIQYNITQQLTTQDNAK